MPSKSGPKGFKNLKKGGRPDVPAGIPEKFKKGGKLGNTPPKARTPTPTGKRSA